MVALGGLDQRSMRGGKAFLNGIAAVALLAGLGVAPAAQAETVGLVVSWFHVAANSKDGDCPKGLNPNGEAMSRRILGEMGKSKAEIEKIMVDFPFNYGTFATMRGRIDGKPVNVYQHPTSVPDPMMYYQEGKEGYGFNLDGKVGPNDYVEADTGETGIDNNMWRALGCFSSLRGSPTTRPTWPAIQWDMTRDQMPALVIEINNVDDRKNDDDVEVGIYRAQEPIVRNVSGDPQVDMTFRVDPDKRLHNTVKGRIKDGMLVTDSFDFFMIVDPFLQPELDIHKARLRLKLADDGTAKGVLGGYTRWDEIYLSYAAGGSTNEGMLALDMPGIYNNLRKLADDDADPKTGMKRRISSAFTVEAIPAFVRHPKEAPARTALSGTFAGGNASN